MNKMTVEKFAEVMGVERNVAYGLLRYLADKGLVKTGKLPQPEGKKGKPAILYFFDQNMGKRLIEHLIKKLPMGMVGEDEPVANQTVVFEAAKLEIKLGS